MKSKRATKTSPAAYEAPDDPASETDAFDASQTSQAHGQEAQVEQRPRSKGKKGSKEKPPTKGGRPVGAQGYSESDTMALLTLIDQDLPRGGNEWDRVRDQYNAQHALVEGRDTRTTDSLKSRFRHVLAPAAPSGKTRCSALRTMAVEIQQRIMNKVHNVTVDDSQSFEERNDNDEYDENSASEHDDDSENQSNNNHVRSEAVPPLKFNPSTCSAVRKSRVPNPSVSFAAVVCRCGRATQKNKLLTVETERFKVFLSVQNASLQEANTALTNRLIALTSELDSKRDRISDLRDEKQQLIDGGIAT
ncbi:hypothetical protein F442_11344 [Phytophthora nicotianae P10297]|uniref:DUF6818 domain-containing protein n=2 Tax=Phytophthora nicotianae TaxID=4792 RepID=W2Z3M7_PHYNI|nr:hypothetical protein F442_11344 [Phytophthora nicotianae P10297]